MRRHQGESVICDVAEITIGSGYEDEFVSKVYLIEVTEEQPHAARRAIELAIEDGMKAPRVVGFVWQHPRAV